VEEQLIEKFDVVVVGAGTGGCMTAKTVAEAGFEVGMIDLKNKDDIGEKVCGNAIGMHHFDNLGIEYPSGKEFKRKIEGGKLYSPDNKTALHIKGAGLPGFIVDRRLFGQRLLKSAVDAGLTLFNSVKALEPITQKSFVTGILARNLKTKRKFRLCSKVTVDASGVSATLRRNLLPEFGIETDMNREDFVVCYREIRELKEEVTAPNFIELYFNQNIAPRGYYWIFPEEEKRVNVGLGVGLFGEFPNPKKQLYEAVLSRSLFEKSVVLKGGGGQVPTRNPLSCMTGNGILIVGDAAYQVNPIHGGGIGPSMLGGAIAGETIIKALERGDISRESLWDYNVKYMQRYGTKQASLDVFRLFLQGLSNDDLNCGMKYRLITEEDILRAAMEGKVQLNITEKTQRILRGLRKLTFLNDLRKVVNLMKKIKAQYKNYPASPKYFEKWDIETKDIVKSVKITFKGTKGT
jgi:geranylgeranyl reductase family protein